MLKRQIEIIIVKINSIILLIVICNLSFAQQTLASSDVSLRDDTITFHSGNGTRDNYLYLYTNGNFRHYFFCDVCPGEESIGTFILKGDTIFRYFTTYTTYGPHYRTPVDTVVVKDTWSDTLYLFYWNSETYLVRSLSDIQKYAAMYAENPDEKLLRWMRQRYFRKDEPIDN